MDGYNSINNANGTVWTIVPTTNTSGAVNAAPITWISVPLGGGWYTSISGDLSGGEVSPPEAKKDNGCACKRCKNFFDMAEPNQEDKSFICWACRHGY